MSRVLLQFFFVLCIRVTRTGTHSFYPPCHSILQRKSFIKRGKKAPYATASRTLQFLPLYVSLSSSSVLIKPNNSSWKSGQGGLLGSFSSRFVRPLRRKKRHMGSGEGRADYPPEIKRKRTPRTPQIRPLTTPNHADRRFCKNEAFSKDSVILRETLAGITWL